MKIVKYAMMVLGLIGVVLSFVYKLPAIGTHGFIVIVCCALPVALGALATVVLPSMPRWASILSALAFLVAAMKTSQGDQLQNIMMASAAGLLAALALAIKPDRRAAAKVAMG